MHVSYDLVLTCDDSTPTCPASDCRQFLRQLTTHLSHVAGDSLRRLSNVCSQMLPGFIFTNIDLERGLHVTVVVSCFRLCNCIINLHKHGVM